MTDDHNMTPEQRQIPANLRARCYERIPKTCDQLRAILVEAGGEFASAYHLPAHDHAIMDAILSAAFLKIRDSITQPFRTEQMKLYYDRSRMLFAIPYANQLHREEPDNLYTALGKEFHKDPGSVRSALFDILYSAQSDLTPGEDILDYCREKLIEKGWVCQTPPK